MSGPLVSKSVLEVSISFYIYKKKALQKQDKLLFSKTVSYQVILQEPIFLCLFANGNSKVSFMQLLLAIREEALGHTQSSC